MFSTSFLLIGNIIVSALACVYGFWTCIRPLTPLFYKIIVYAFGSYFLSSAYSLLFRALGGDAMGFHAGYMGYVGTFFFLFSSYFGALDRLADDQNTVNRKYRFLALFPAVLILIMAGNIFKLILLMPIAGTAYFACKHMLLPDIEMGIIRVLRPYNVIILMFCLNQPFTIDFLLRNEPAGMIYLFAKVFNMLLIASALPLAYRGVQKWFI